MRYEILQKDQFQDIKKLDASFLSELRSDFLPPKWLFAEEEASIAFLSFQNSLESIENQIIERTSELVERGKAPYEVLLPSQIPCGITM